MARKSYKEKMLDKVWLRFSDVLRDAQKLKECETLEKRRIWRGIMEEDTHAAKAVINIYMDVFNVSVCDVFEEIKKHTNFMTFEDKEIGITPLVKKDVYDLKIAELKRWLCLED